MSQPQVFFLQKKNLGTVLRAPSTDFNNFSCVDTLRLCTFQILFFVGVCLVRYLRIPRKICWRREFRKYHISQVKFQKNQNFLSKTQRFDTQLWVSFGPSGIEAQSVTNGLISWDVFYRISSFSTSDDQSWSESLQKPTIDSPNCSSDHSQPFWTCFEPPTHVFRYREAI